MGTILVIIVAILIVLAVAIIKRKSIKHHYRIYQDRKLRKWCVKRCTLTAHEDTSKAEDYYLFIKNIITWNAEFINQDPEAKRGDKKTVT